jgi:hypothetical protein
LVAKGGWGQAPYRIDRILDYSVDVVTQKPTNQGEYHPFDCTPQPLVALQLEDFIHDQHENPNRDFFVQPFPCIPILAIRVGGSIRLRVRLVFLLATTTATATATATATNTTKTTTTTTTSITAATTTAATFWGGRCCTIPATLPMNRKAISAQLGLDLSCKAALFGVRPFSGWTQFTV